MFHLKENKFLKLLDLSPEEIEGLFGILPAPDAEAGGDQLVPRIAQSGHMSEQPVPILGCIAEAEAGGSAAVDAPF